MGRGWFLGAVGVLAFAIGVAMAACGSNPTDAPPFAVSEAEAKAECMTGTFVPEETGFALLEEKPPSSWEAIEDAPGAMQAERGAALLTLRPQAGAARITFTHVKFEIDNLGLRPIGTVFYKPCKRRPKGAAIEGNLDRFGHLHESSAALDGTLGKGFFAPESAQPISFPWTVSLRRPLHLYLVVEAYDVWAKWTARLAWKSGSSHGVIHLDNHGRKYEVVDGAGSSWYRPGRGMWLPQGESTWLGVR